LLKAPHRVSDTEQTEIGKVHSGKVEKALKRFMSRRQIYKPGPNTHDTQVWSRCCPQNNCGTVDWIFSFFHRRQRRGWTPPHSGNL